MMLPVRLLGSRFEVMNFMSIMILGLMCPMMPCSIVPGVSTDKHYCCKLMT